MSLDAGVPTSQSCLDAYEKFKMGKQYEFLLFKANDKATEIVVDVHPAMGDSEKIWGEKGSKSNVAREKDEPVEFWNMRRMILEKKEPRYAIIMVGSSNKKQTMTMLFWAPEDAPTKQKMVYSSTKFSFKNKLAGIQAMLQCNDLEELSYSDVYKNAMKL